jgi:4-alpha-glucanotransferase
MQQWCAQHEDDILFWSWLQWLAQQQFAACWQRSPRRYDGVKRRLVAQRIAAFSQKLLKRRLPGQLRLCVVLYIDINQIDEFTQSDAAQRWWHSAPTRKALKQARGVKRRLVAQRIAAFSQKLLKRRLPGQLRLCVLPDKTPPS